MRGRADHEQEQRDQQKQQMKPHRAHEVGPQPVVPGACSSCIAGIVSPLLMKGAST